MINSLLLSSAIPQTGLISSLDASRLLGNGTTNPSNGSAVSTWQDLSASNITWTQDTGANQPVYRTAGLNNRPSVEFTYAAPHFLTASSSLEFLTTGTFFCVRNYVNIGNLVQYYFANDDNGNLSGGFASEDDFDSRGAITLWEGSSNRLDAASTASLTTTPSIYMHKLNLIRRNNVDLTLLNTAVSPSSLTINKLGSRQASANLSFQGHISEILLYDRSLSEPEITQVVNYLTKKWRIA